MANSDKNIRITPNRGTTSFPKIVFTGQANDPITVNVLDDNSLSFSGSAGQLFSLSNNISTGTIFSVNDISGFPAFRINANGNVSVNEFSGNFGIGISNPFYKFQVIGNVGISGGVALTAGLATTSSSSGTLVVTGGASVGSSLSVGGSVLLWNGANYTAFRYTGIATTIYTLPSSSPAIGTSVLQSDTSGILSWVPMTATGSAGGAGTVNNSAANLIAFYPSAGTAVTGNTSLSASGTGLSIGFTTASTSTITGALTVSGGVGIGGSVNIGGRVGIGTNLLTGQINIQNPTSTTPSILIQGATSQSEDYLRILSSTGTTTFSINSTGRLSWPASSPAQIYNTGYSSQGRIVVSGNLYVNPGPFIVDTGGGEASMTSTALSFAGGIGLGVYTTNTLSTDNAFRVQPTSTSVIPIVINAQNASWTSGNLFLIQNNGSNVFSVDYAGNTNIFSTAGSASTTTGALIVRGGVGIGQTLFTSASYASSVSGVILSNGTVTGNLTGTATTATYSHQAGYAITSGSSATATTATYSHQAGYAITSGSSGTATSATYANQAGYAITAGSANAWTTPRTLNLSGDLSGSVVWSGSGDTTITATINANSVALGTDTTGQYASTITISGSGITATASNADDATGYTIYSSATASNVSSSIVLRDGSGNFSAGTITGSLSGTASTATYANQSGYAITSGSSSSSAIATTASNLNVSTASNNIFNSILFTPQGTGTGVAVSSFPSFSFNPTANILNVSGVAITASTASTSTSTGALLVSGGVGIGGSVFSSGRFNFGTLSAPTMSTLSGFGTGGLTPSTTYYYKVSAIDFNNNESLPSPEYSVALSGSQYGTRFYIGLVNGAVGYKLYRTTTSGSYTNSFVQTYRFNQFLNGVFLYDIGRPTSTGTPLTTPTGNTATLGSDSTSPSNTLPSLTIPSGVLQVKSPNFTGYAPTIRGVSIETGAYDFIQIRDPYGYNNSVSASTGGTLTAGQTYYYVFTCLDHYGNESLPSQEIAFTADSGGAALFSFSVLTVQQATRRFYRTTTSGNYTNSYIGEISDHKDINYPTKNISPPTTTQFVGSRILPAPDFGQYSFIPNIDVAPSARNGAIRKIGYPYSSTLTLTTSGTAGSLLTNTTYYYKFVEVDIFGGSTYPSQEYSIGTGTSTAVTINTAAGLWIEAKNYIKIYRSLSSNNFSNVPTYIVNSFPFTDVGDTTFTETPPSSATNITGQLFFNGNNQVPQNYLISLAVGPPSNSAPFALLAPQTAISSISASTGGTLTSGQVYYYVMSPLDVLGFEGVSLQPFRFVATAGGAANITPGAIFGNSGYVCYNLYRSTTLASWSNTLIASGVRGNFIDVNYPTRSGSPTFGHHRARAVVYNNSSNLFIPTLVNQTYGQHLTPPGIYRTGGNSSGTLATNTTYYYRVLPFGGYSQQWGYASDEFSYTTGANERNITLSIGGHKTGAIGYRVYRSTSFNNFTNAYYFETQHVDFQDLGFSTLQATPDLGVLANPQATTVNRLDQANGNVLVNTVITGQNGALKIHMKSPSALSLSSGIGGTLANNTDYFYRVEAVDIYGARSFPSEEAWINTASDNAVTITWNESPGASYYRIFRTTTSQSYTNTLIAGYVIARTFTDINYPVTSGTPWSYGNYPGTGIAAIFQMDNAKNFGVMPRTIISNIDSTQSSWNTDFSLRITSPPVGSASAALLQVGAGFTNFSSAGFNGTTFGTQIAIGAATGFTGSLLDAQTAGVSRFRINFDGSSNIGSTTASTSSTTGALTIAGGVGIGGSLYVTGAMNVGSNTFIKNYSGDLNFDNGTSDTPGIRYYWLNNRNFGNDVFSGSGITKWRVVREMGETGGVELFTVDREGVTYIHNPAGGSSGLRYTGSGNTIYTLPSSSPATGSSVLQSDSTGILSWVPMTAGGGSGSVNNSAANLVAFYPSAGTAVTGNTSVSISGTGLSIGFNTNSTSTNTGALIVSGSVGIAGSIFIGNQITQTFNPTTGAGSDHAYFIQSSPLRTSIGSLIQIGTAALWDGATSGFFTGSANGTYIGINAATGTTASAIDFQIAGATRFQVGSGGSTIINNYTEIKAPDTTNKALRVLGFSSATQGDILSFEHPAGGSFVMNGNFAGQAGGRFTIIASGNSQVRAATFAIQASDTKTVLNVDATSGAGALSLQNATNLQLFNSTNAQYAGFRYTGTSTTTYTLPASAPGAGTSVLQSDTAGNMSWVAMASGGGGSGTVTTLTAGTGVTFSTGTTITTTGTIRAKRHVNLTFCSGYTPAASGADTVVLRVPDSPSDGVTALTYKPQEFFIRVETASATASTIQLEKFTGTGAFSGTAITSIGISGAATFERAGTVFAAAGSLLTSGDKLRINFTTLSASHANFSVFLLLEEV